MINSINAQASGDIGAVKLPLVCKFGRELFGVSIQARLHTFHLEVKRPGNTTEHEMGKRTGHPFS